MKQNIIKDIKKQDHFKELVVSNTPGYFKTENYLHYRNLWKTCPTNHIVPNFPINLDLHITNKCNLKCPFCPRTWNDLAGGFETYGFMSMELYKKIVDEGIKEGVKALHFTANGEPLLHKGLEEMIKYANEKGILEVIIHTNAVGLSEKRSKSLLDAGVHRLAISFDSPEKESYEKLRVGANFEKTLRNIKRFVEIRNKQNKQLPTVRVQMVDQGDNIHLREKFDEMFGSIADSVSHVPYIDYNGGPSSYVDEKTIDGSNMSIGKKKLKENFSCSYLWQRRIIEWDGVVYPCFYGFDMKMGSLKENTIKEIWHGKKMTELRQLHSTGNYNKCGDCNKCGRQFETIEDDTYLSSD